LVAERFVQALDDGVVAGGSLRFREADDDAEADEQRKDEHGACADALQRSNRHLLNFGWTHASPPAPRPERGCGTS
jgi:hypothetical protein